MQQHIGMHHQEKSGTERKEAEQRQLDTEKRQLDRGFEEKVSLCGAANCDQKVEQHEQIAEPKAGTDGSRIDDRGA